MVDDRLKVIVGDGPLHIDDVVAVAGGALVELSPNAARRIRESRDVIEQALAHEKPTYGLNRGVGHDKDRRISVDELTQFSFMLLRSHEGGFGPPLPAAVVRAAILARVSGIAGGGSGASPAMPETLVAMLNAGVIPVVPSIGSVGAGDLGQMASIGRVAIGEGLADYHDERLSGSVALDKAGIAPLVLGPKDGLTMMSANAVSVGHAALVARRVRNAAETADLVAALSLEAVGGNISVVDPAVGRAKPFPGQVAAAEHIRALLRGSYLQSQDFASVQDALSFRVVPQVHGALREFTSFAINAVETELNSPGDNPLVSPDGRLVHNGNFEPLVMAVAFDSVRVALAHVGQISERRMSHLWDAMFKRPEALASGQPFYGLKLRYPAAARFTELRRLAAPATLDVPTLDIGVEDHASGAPLSVSTTDAAVAALEDLLAIEVLLGRDLLTAGGRRPQLGDGPAALMNDLDRAIAAVNPGASVAEVHIAIRDALTRRD